MEKWYYAENGQNSGPFTEEEMKIFAQNVLTAETMVYSKEKPERGWVKAADTELSKFFVGNQPREKVSDTTVVTIVLILVLTVFISRALDSLTGQIDATSQPSDPPDSVANTIINNLRALKDAYLLYHTDTGEWLKFGEEAMLDRYTHEPIVSNHRWYEGGRIKITIGEEYYDSSGKSRVNIGAELSPSQSRKWNKELQKTLSEKASEAGLMQTDQDAQSAYRSGLNVYMNVR